jgi:adhesin/invasin
VLGVLCAVGVALASTGPPTTVTVTFSPNTVPANGTATSTLTVRVTDASGNGVSGQSVTLGSSDAGDVIGAVTDHNDGSYTATITSSSAPGPATITATDTTASLEGTGTLYQYGPAASVSVSANPTAIVADGFSTTTATAAVLDAEGDPIPGRAVTISSDSGNAIGAVTDNGNGTYSATITSTTTEKGVTITAADTTDNISGQGTLAQTAGSATSVSVSLRPGSIVADGKSTTRATAAVTDQFGNPVAGETILWSTDDAGSQFGAVTDNGDGTYSATITSSTTAHNVKVTATDQTASISGSATLAQTAGPAAAVVVSLVPLQIVADGASTTVATATVRDAEGHPVPGQTVTFSSSDGGVGFGATIDNGDGTYSATVTSSTVVGKPTITAHDGALTGVATLTQTVGAAAVVVVSLVPLQIVADGASTTVATATVRDAEGHPVPGGHVTFSSSDRNNRIGPVTDRGDGTYTAAIGSSTSLGKLTITAHDGALTGTATLTQTVGPAATITVSLNPGSIVADGTSTTTATATVTDRAGNPVVGDPVHFGSSDAGNQIGLVTDDGHGSYSTTITASTKVGQATITASDGAASGTATLTQLNLPAARMVLRLARSRIVADGRARTTATVVVDDAGGRGVADQAIGVVTSDPGVGVGADTDHGNGTYSAVLTASGKVHRVVVTATDYSVTPALTATVTLLLVPGPPSSMTLSFTPRSVPANGHARVTVTATVTDASGHQLARQHLKFTSSDRGIKIGRVKSHSDGTYTVLITSSRTAHLVRIRATDLSASPAISVQALLPETRSAGGA